MLTSVRDVPQLSPEAKTLLVEAAQDPQGNIMHIKYIGGEDLQTNGKEFIEQGDPRSRAAQGALEELEEHGLIKALGFKGEVYEVTREGYSMAELLQG
jgi:hypothetical protein